MGSYLAPKIRKLQKGKRLLILEGPSDKDVLEAFYRKLHGTWPDNIVVWERAGNSFEGRKHGRKQLFQELAAEIKGLRGISIEDRDDNLPYTEVAENLSIPGKGPSRLKQMIWKRRNLENYLLLPVAIARACKAEEEEVREYLLRVHGYAIPGSFQAADCHPSLALIDGKKIMSSLPDCVRSEFGVEASEIAQAMLENEIPEDMITAIRAIHELQAAMVATPQPVGGN